MAIYKIKGKSINEVHNRGAKNEPYLTTHDAVSGNYVSPPNSYTRIGQDYNDYYTIRCYTIWRCFFIFDLSSIPAGENIISASLHLGIWDRDNDTDWSLVIMNGQPTYPHDPVVLGDYGLSQYSGNGGSKALSGFPGYHPDDNYIDITKLEWITKGITKLALISSLDISVTAPTTDNDKITLYPDNSVNYASYLSVETEPPPVLTNIGAENNRVFARTVLTGEISDISGTIVERGFEYKIQDAEPGSGDTGTEVKETNAEGFDAGEYSLRNKELYDQQYIADDIIWWFRAYCKDVGDNKFVADSWMKNLPNVITQAMTSINYNKADGNGIIISEGASDLTKRGFEVMHEYYDSYRNSWKFDIAGFEGKLECVYVLDDLRIVIDVKWEGELIKTALETYELELGAYVITIGQMIFGWPLANDCLIEGKSYKCKAFASNEFGTAYGEEVEFSTPPRTYLCDNPPTGNIKNEVIENLPAGVTASRRGFRFGTTESADEFDVHEDGSFTNGPFSTMLPDLLPDTTYYIVAYIVVNGIIHEGDMEIITTDPEVEEEIKNSPRGQDYREISTKVFAEVLASQGIIDFSGGKKTLSISNHLIQTNTVAKTIAKKYLERFKLAKTRMEVTFPTPLPFERGDTIDFSFGELSFKEEDRGITNFKGDGEGVAVLKDQITMIIKKINSVNLTKTETSIEYVAILDLEHR